MTPLPEQHAAEQIAETIGKWLSPAWLSDECLRAVAAKAVAHRAYLRRVFDELDADPSRLPDRDVLLRQDSTAQHDDPEWWSEHVHHLRRELADAEAIWGRVKAAQRSGYEHDPDERGREEDAAREAIERAAEETQAVRL